MLKIVFYLVSYYKRLKTNAQNCILDLPTENHEKGDEDENIDKNQNR